MLERFEVSLGAQGDLDINNCRFGPFEVGERAIEIGAGLELETSPEVWDLYKGRAPISTDVRGGDQIPVAVMILENP